jgi:hypothetical protein
VWDAVLSVGIKASFDPIWRTQFEEITVTEAEGAGEQAADFSVEPSIFRLVSPVL